MILMKAAVQIRQAVLDNWRPLIHNQFNGGQVRRQSQEYSPGKSQAEDVSRGLQ